MLLAYLILILQYSVTSGGNSAITSCVQPCKQGDTAVGQTVPEVSSGSPNYKSSQDKTVFLPIP